MAKHHKILVRTPNWIGDHVMAQPFYSSLLKAYPHSEIHFLSSEALSTFDDSLFSQTKKILPKNIKGLGATFFLFAKELEKEKYDLALSLTSSLSSSLLLRAAKIPLRVGFAEGGSGLFFTDSIKWKGIKGNKHKSEIYLDLLNFITGKQWALSGKKWGFKKNTETRNKRIVLAPGASIALRVWPYFGELISELAKTYTDYEIAIVGSFTESYWHAEIENLKLSNVKDWIGRTSLVELIAICKGSALVVANDSGVAHLAGTQAGVPTVVIYGPGDPKYIRPLGDEVYLETPVGLACHPCEKSYCHEKYGYQACLLSISLEKVVSGVKRILTI